MGLEEGTGMTVSRLEGRYLVQTRQRFFQTAASPSRFAVSSGITDGTDDSCRLVVQIISTATLKTPAPSCRLALQSPTTESAKPFENALLLAQAGIYRTKSTHSGEFHYPGPRILHTIASKGLVARFGSAIEQS
jgi:hypothetical protein